MKSQKILGIALSLLLFAACKKNTPLPDPIVEKPDPLELAGDSASYTIDGKLSIVNKVNSGGALNRQPNSKVDSIVKDYHYYISGDKDSVFYGRRYDIHDSEYDNTVSFFFLKKYHKNAMEGNGILFPKNGIGLYSVGKYNYALDFGRDNSQNGVALEVRKLKEYYQTYGSDSWREPQVLKPDAQSQSTFEITNLKKLKSGIYILEAKFSATIFDRNFKPKKIENGYLRLRLGYF